MEEINLKTNSKFCKYCGKIIPKEVIICIKCGCQVEDIKSSNNPQIIINNNNSNINKNINTNEEVVFRKRKNKWVAFILCLLFGFFGIHKFYEGKVGIGIVYFFTAGVFGFGWIIDCIILLFKTNPYYV